MISTKYRSLMTFIASCLIFLAFAMLSVSAVTCVGTGGTITTNATNCIHTFTANGTFSYTGSTTAELLIVAGGGGGGKGSAGGGGGGAGGVIYNRTYALTTGTYNITVGVGGYGATASGEQSGTKGQNSSFHNIFRANGGGLGRGEGSPAGDGRPGGSGSGSRYGGGAGGVAEPVGQGNNGGGSSTGGCRGGGGGGGYSQVGDAGISTRGGYGGNGTQIGITGSMIYYAGGGAGGSTGLGTCYNVTGGLGGGGGMGSGSSGVAGTNGTGGGGSGTGSLSGDGVVGGDGGSGVVIISYAGTSTSAGIVINDAVLRDRSNNILNKSNIAQFQTFKIAGNVTEDGLYTGSSVCAYSANNITERFEDRIGNYTITSTHTYEYKYNTYLTQNATKDIISFYLCRSGVPTTDVTYYLNNNASIYRTITGSDIPQCSSGLYHTEINVSILTTFTQQLNLSVRCTGCSGGQSVTMIALNDSTTSFLQRQYSHHAESLTYNSTTKYYEDADLGLHNFFNYGNNYVNISCNLSKSSGLFSVFASPQDVVSQLDEIIIDGNISYTFRLNNTQVEAGSQYTIIGDCFSYSPIIFRQMNISYATGNFSLIASVNADSYTFPKENFPQDGAYKVMLHCRDAQSNFYLDRNLIINDTTPPFIVWNSPLEDGSTTIYSNQSLSLDITAIDPNIFSVNVVCKDPLGVTKHSFYIENITSNPYQYINVTSSITNLGIGNCNVTVKDRHTKKDIDSYTINTKPQQDDLTFEYDRTVLNISSLNKVKEWKVEKSKDRYTFEPVYNTKKLAELDYTVSCTGGLLYYFDDQKIDVDNDKYGHTFLCNDMWIDFLMTGMTYKDYKVVKLHDGTYKVNIKNTGNMDSYKTQSVGIINTVSEQVNFNVVTAPGQVITSQMAVSVLWVVLAIWFSTLILGFLFINSPMGLIFGVTSGITGIITGLNLVSYNTYIGYLFTLMNVFILGIGVWFVWNESR